MVGDNESLIREGNKKEKKKKKKDAMMQRHDSPPPNQQTNAHPVPEQQLLWKAPGFYC